MFRSSLLSWISVNTKRYKPTFLVKYHFRNDPKNAGKFVLFTTRNSFQEYNIFCKAKLSQMILHRNVRSVYVEIHVGI